MPLVILLPAISLILVSGRWMPSKMLVSTPGASSTDRGAPVDSTMSPGPMPAVSSYT